MLDPKLHFYPSEITGMEKNVRASYGDGTWKQACLENSWHTYFVSNLFAQFLICSIEVIS